MIEIIYINIFAFQNFPFGEKNFRIFLGQLKKQNFLKNIEKKTLISVHKEMYNFAQGATNHTFI